MTFSLRDYFFVQLNPKNIRCEMLIPSPTTDGAEHYVVRTLDLPTLEVEHGDKKLAPDVFAIKPLEVKKKMEEQQVQTTSITVTNALQLPTIVGATTS